MSIPIDTSLFKITSGLESKNTQKDKTLVFKFAFTQAQPEIHTGDTRVKGANESKTAGV
jgi:hypothetical protein